MLLGWKRKNKFLTVSGSQIKGMIVISLIMAIISFVSYYSLFHVPKYPVFIDQAGNSLAIKVVENNKQEGIYFVDSDSTFEQFLKDIGISGVPSLNFKLKDGIKINISSESENRGIGISKITGAEKLALGMPLDLNQASKEELQLLKGIGEVTAGEILNLRKSLGRFENITQLTEIKGIKERKLAEIRKYLYIEKHSQ